jgi:single-strand DNA-binding protein
MIKMQVIGNLGKDCTTNMVNGKNVINFNVAHTEKIKDATGNTKDKTIWVDCAYWTDRTGIAPYLKKGQQVHVDGIPDLRTYTKNDGTFGATMTLRVLSVQLLGSAGRSEEEGLRPMTAKQPAEASGAYVAPGAEGGAAGGEDDLPF